MGKNMLQFKPRRRKGRVGPKREWGGVILSEAADERAWRVT